ncbi:MAG: hypothetical protein CFK52_07215 [Chloracidobacterium sp. CP2_5A]|nr:MAG: hypothetical protein CFK52_07215 [Chloracidobacterium sp. CP2_5A]
MAARSIAVGQRWRLAALGEGPPRDGWALLAAAEKISACGAAFLDNAPKVNKVSAAAFRRF